MKKVVIALVAALLIAVQCLTPVAAASPAAESGAVACGDTYTVKPLDYLAKIAAECGTTVADILARNPQITNPNLIFAGQVLRLTGTPTTPTIPTVPGTPASTYRVVFGDTLFAISLRFGTTVSALLQANPNIWSASVIYVGQVINIPSGSTNPPPVTPPPGGQTPTGFPRVTLSRTTAGTGDAVTVSISGFPATADIDYRVGQQGEGYSAAYDGVVGANGTASMTITIPGDALEGEYWVVRVMTTGMKNGVEASSPLIYIDN